MRNIRAIRLVPGGFLATLLVAGLTACTAASGDSATAPVSSAVTSASPIASPTPTDVGPSYVPVRDDDSKPFGAYYMFAPTKADSLRYSRDLIVQVDEAGAYKPSASAYIQGAKAKQYARYKATVINNTTLSVDPSTFQLSAQDGDAAAAAVQDDALASLQAKSPIRPGRTYHWYDAYGDDANAPAVSIEPTVPDATGTYDGVTIGTGTWTP